MKSKESGRISIFLLVLSLVVISFVLISATITTVHIQRRALYTCADAVALGTATELRPASYYRSSSATSSGDSQAVALAVLTELRDTTCAIGLSPRIDQVRVAERSTTVELSVIPRIDLLPSWVEDRVQPPRIRVASTAQLR